MEDLVIYKNTEDDDLLYAFHWATISPDICYVYDYREKYWWSSGLEAKDFLKQANVAEEWTVTNLLDVLVATGWTEESVLKELIDQSPGGWEALQRNLHIAENFEEGKKVLEGLPKLNPEERDYRLAELGKELYVRKLAALPNDKNVKKIEEVIKHLLQRRKEEDAKAVQDEPEVSRDGS